MNANQQSRRSIMKAGALAAVAGPLVGLAAMARGAEPAAVTTAAGSGAAVPKADRFLGLKISVATYTFRQRPVEPTIAGIKRVGIKYASIKDFHLPLKSTAAERKEVATKFRTAGIEVLSCGVIAMPNSEEKIRQAFEYARDAGIPTIVCSPVKEALATIEKCVKEFDIKIAIHNHGPGDKWASPLDVWPAIEPMDPRMGLCIDVGHTARAGTDPAEAIRKTAARLYDVHFKDVDSTAKTGKPLEMGRGVLDVRAMVQALLDIKFQGLVSFEYEKDMDDPLPGLAESIGYVGGVMSDMKAG